MLSAIIRPVLLATLLTASALWASPMPAEESGLRGPVMGYAFDLERHAIRPVNGIPGSSVLGRPLDLPFPIASAALSPLGNFGLIVSASDDHGAHLLGNLDGTPYITQIEGAMSGADSVFLNADASAAALLASQSRQLQILRGLPSSPTVGPTIDLSSISETITTLVIDRNGSNILIAASADRGALYLLSADGNNPPRLIASLGSPTALALVHGDQDVVIADAAVNEITLLRNFGGTPELFLLAGARDGISGPSGLWALDDRTLYISNRESRTLSIWNFESQTIEASFSLDADPTRLHPLQGSSIFVLNDIGDHPLLLLDAAVNPGVYFVPADRDR